MFDSDGFTSAELGHVADALLRGGDLDGAREAYARALALSESAGDDAGAAECREGLGRTALAAGDYDTGLEQLLLAYGHYSSHGVEVAAARSAYRALLPLAMQGRFAEARVLLAANFDTLLRNDDTLFPSEDVLSVDAFLRRRDAAG